MKTSSNITLKGEKPCVLVWNKSAMFRADECGLFSTKGIGFAKAAKYVWSMLPDTLRKKYSGPEDVAEVMPSIAECSSAIDAAISEAGEGMTAKNVFGSTSGRSPASS